MRKRRLDGVGSAWGPISSAVMRVISAACRKEYTKAEERVWRAMGGAHHTILYYKSS